MYGKKEERNRFTGWIAAGVLAAAVVFAGVSGCGRKEAVRLETASAMSEALDGGFREAGQEMAEGLSGSGGAESGTETRPEWETDSGAILPETIQVHVCGAVEKPGVYGLPVGSRVFEAVEAAGGMKEEAAADYLNLADLVFDGAKVRVPFLSELSKEEVYGPDDAHGVSESRGTDNSGSEGLVDLNHADRETLMSLPGIGETKAEAILSWREEHGDFGKPEDIMQVPGIKEAAYEKLKHKITVR